MVLGNLTKTKSKVGYMWAYIFKFKYEHYDYLDTNNIDDLLGGLVVGPFWMLGAQLGR